MKDRLDTLKQREFEFTDTDFLCLQRLVTDHTGIVVTDAKRDMIYSRLSRRLRALGFARFADYCAYLRLHEAEELTELINAVTTNLTSFFREPHHFEHLAQVVVPALLQTNEASRKIRIWSAGCSTGEEPYSIAMILKECLPPWLNWDVRILATDIDTNVVASAAQGIYPLERLHGVSEERKKRFFLRGVGKHQGQVRVSDDLRAMVTFKPLNLLKDWPMKGPFDVIFCRNVMIYFDKPTQQQLVERFAGVLVPKGHLYIGHSESIKGLTERFLAVGKTIYQRRI